MPEKEKSKIGREIYEDGTELSGGQTQRLMLARALYKDAPILVLDEPTAAHTQSQKTIFIGNTAA